jgi:hypothetical protein
MCFDWRETLKTGVEQGRPDLEGHVARVGDGKIVGPRDAHAGRAGSHFTLLLGLTTVIASPAAKSWRWPKTPTPLPFWPLDSQATTNWLVPVAPTEAYR